LSSTCLGGLVEAGVVVDLLDGGVEGVLGGLDVGLGLGAGAGDLLVALVAGGLGLLVDLVEAAVLGLAAAQLDQAGVAGEGIDGVEQEGDVVEADVVDAVAVEVAAALVEDEELVAEEVEVGDDDHVLALARALARRLAGADVRRDDLALGAHGAGARELGPLQARTACGARPSRRTC
jgi:hypothetical protein